MYLLKQCPRCNGDLATGSDQYGQYVSCMQCGFCKDIQTEGFQTPQINFDSARPTAGEVLVGELHRTVVHENLVNRMPVAIAG